MSWSNAGTNAASTAPTATCRRRSTRTSTIVSATPADGSRIPLRAAAQTAALPHQMKPVARDHQPSRQMVLAAFATVAYRMLSRNSVTSSCHAVGFSRCTSWPAPATSTYRAWTNPSAIARKSSFGAEPCLPATTSAGH